MLDLPPLLKAFYAIYNPCVRYARFTSFTLGEVAENKTHNCI
jgi:hypothetical protein